MAEFITMEQADERFGKKGVANSGLTLGIIGTALAAFGGNGILGGIFGGGNTTTANGLCTVPSIWEICEKQNAENVALTSAIYQSRIKEIEDLNGVYQSVNSRLVELEKKDAALEASLPLAMQLAAVTAERYTDNKVSHDREHQAAINCALQSEILMRPKGDVRLSMSSLYTGVPQMPRIVYQTKDCGCGCGDSSAS